METEKTHKKRPWTRRTRELTPPIPPDIYKPEIIEEIKQRGESFMTPYEALTRFGFAIDESQIPYLDSLFTEVNHQLFVKGENSTAFRCGNINEFIKIAATGNMPFAILECSTLSPFEKERILHGASESLSQVALEKRERDWQK